MDTFFDLHSHMLCGVDDGAQTPEEMYAMLEMAYEDGTRALCLTPHYSPFHFGDTSQKALESFELLQAYVQKNHPDMRLYLGHELGYHSSCLESLKSGRCRTIAGSRYVLVDFPETVSFFEIEKAMDMLQASGYIPILAHTERYRCLFGKLSWLNYYVDCGGIVQVNASSITGDWGWQVKKQWKKLFRAELVQLISTDAHNLTTRPPKMSACMKYLKKNCFAEGIRMLTWETANRIVQNLPIERE